MKISKKNLLLPISILATALITSGVVYALSSGNFSTQAAAWASANCTSALSTSKATAANEQKSIICYNYNKINEQALSVTGLQSVTNAQSSRISSISNSVSALQARANLYVSDSNGNILGTLTSMPAGGGHFQFYNSQVGLIVDLQETNPNNYRVEGNYLQSIYYTQPNCQGDWYSAYTSGDQYQTLVNPSLILSNSPFLKFDKNSTLIRGNSILSVYTKDTSRSSGYVCDNIGQGQWVYYVGDNNYYVHLLQVPNLPFSSNITGPLNLVQ